MIDVWFIHGLGDSPRVWRDARRRRALSAYRTIAPALPGFGGTTPLGARERSVFGLARWLEAAIRRRSRGRRVLLVGHSMGGMIVTLGARMPEVSGIVNIEGPLTLPDCDTARQAAKAKDFSRWFRAFRHSVRSPSGGAPAHYAASIEGADGASFLSCAKGIVSLARGARMGKLYASLRVPSIYFYGAGPGGISETSRRFLVTRRCLTQAFEAAGHWPMTESPDQFADALARSLKRLAHAGP